MYTLALKCAAAPAGKADDAAEELTDDQVARLRADALAMHADFERRAADLGKRQDTEFREFARRFKAELRTIEERHETEWSLFNGNYDAVLGSRISTLADYGEDDGLYSGAMGDWNGGSYRETDPEDLSTWL